VTLFKQLEDAKKQVEVLKQTGAQVTSSSLRDMVSTLTARAAGAKNLVAGSTSRMHWPGKPS
jgi:hypothetical protein